MVFALSLASTPKKHQAVIGMFAFCRAVSGIRNYKYVSDMIQTACTPLCKDVMEHCQQSVVSSTK